MYRETVQQSHNPPQVNDCEQSMTESDGLKPLQSYSLFLNQARVVELSDFKTLVFFERHLEGLLNEE